MDIGPLESPKFPITGNLWAEKGVWYLSLNAPTGWPSDNLSHLLAHGQKLELVDFDLKTRSIILRTNA